MVQRVDRMRALMVQRAAQPDCVALFRLDAGLIAGPLPFAISSAEHTKSQSMEARVQAALGAMTPGAAESPLERMEHLALLKRWYYRGSRAGEVFFADAKGELPMRRVVRGISRVFRGEAPEESAPKAGEAPG